MVTPQDVAHLDARKLLEMLVDAKVPVLGAVESMSGMLCPHCKEPLDVFPRVATDRSIWSSGVVKLGTVPLDPALAEAGDRGRPLLVSRPDGPQPDVFRTIAAELSEALERRSGALCRKQWRAAIGTAVEETELVPRGPSRGRAVGVTVKLISLGAEGDSMADAALFIGFGRPARAREPQAIELFERALEFFTELEGRGEIEGLEAVMLEPHGGELNGFFLLRGARERLDGLRADEEFRRLSARAGLVVDDFGVVAGHVGEGLRDQLSLYRDQVEAQLGAS